MLPSAEEIGTRAQQAVLDSIPSKWKLALQTQAPSNVMEIPKTCGILTSKQIEITDQTATDLLEKLANQTLSSAEVTEAFCARAAIAHQLTNCLTSFFPQEAMERARALDAHLKNTGNLVGPLHGLPVSIKDIYDLAGHVVTLGYISWRNVIAEKDSVLVKVLRDAGAVFFVKTTMPQTGMALETWSTLWGRTLNPRNSKLGSGGSSGGEGALIAMRGSPIGPASDIGGSIRVPAAFNGLYSIRPSSDRIPRGGIRGTVSGQVSIKVSCGPLCHSMADLSMFTKIINGHPLAQQDGSFVPMPWRAVQSPTKLTVGILEFDGVCMPHPPILRAIRETALKLNSAGHDVVRLTLPFDCWEVALTTWKLYFQTGAAEHKAAIKEGDEKMIPSLSSHLNIFDIKPLSVPELFALNTKQAFYKAQMAAFWRSTAETNSTRLPMDAIICPVNPSAGLPYVYPRRHFYCKRPTSRETGSQILFLDGFLRCETYHTIQLHQDYLVNVNLPSHDFACWWGYTSLFNILDYPSTTLPICDLKISAEKDPKDMEYKPVRNPFDQSTHDMYDPELFLSQPVCLQVVGRPYHDEELVAVSQVIDRIVNLSNVCSPSPEEGEDGTWVLRNNGSPSRQSF